MIKTFVYGTPLGFDFYEGDDAYKDYFKSFYISSRKGRRLMVNRRDNGETTYNYLRYGLREAEIRPNSFFGMTLVMDEWRYCPDFIKMLQWFDRIYEKIIEKQNILRKGDDGEIQYVVKKFEDNSDGVEWVKKNLPNIFLPKAGTTISSYDNTFTKDTSGQIPCLNDELSNQNYLSAFKQHCWVTLSSEIAKPSSVNGLATHNESAVSTVVELSYADVKAQLNDFNKKLLPIATGEIEGGKDELERMQKDARQTIAHIRAYLVFTKDDEVANDFRALENDYESLVKSIGVLFSKGQTNQTPECSGGGGVMALPPSPQSKSEAKNEINKGCSGESLWEVKKDKLIPILVIAAVFVGIGLIYLCLSDHIDSEANLREADIVNTEIEKDENHVSPEKLQELLANSQFNEAYKYIKEKDDEAKYHNTILEAIDKMLWTLIDASENKEIEELEKELQIRVMGLSEPLQSLGKDKDEYMNELKEGAIDYIQLQAILTKKNTITITEYQEGLDILKRIGSKLPSDWSSTLDSKWNASQLIRNSIADDKQDQNPVPPASGNEEQANTPLVQGPITLTYTNKSKTLVKVENLSGNRGFDASPGSTVFISFPYGKIKYESETYNDEISVKLDNKVSETKQYTFRCGDKTTITITIYPESTFNEL